MVYLFEQPAEFSNFGGYSLSEMAGLPVWVGLSCEPSNDGTMRLLEGEPLGDAIDALKGRNVPLISIMHTEVRDIDACLDIVEGHWDGLVGVYAHTGDYRDMKWIFDGIISPADYAAAAQGWLDRGVNLVGGCCGIWPDHIAAVRETAGVVTSSGVLSR